MVTTNAAMSATQNWVPLAVPSSLEPGFYTIDSENIRVRSEERRTTDTVLSPPNGRFIERGVGGTAAASHSSGATLTRYYPDAAAPAAGTSLSEDIVAALEGADSPSGANPFTTGLRSKTVTVTSAELLALAATPKTLVPFVAGKAYCPVALTFVARFGTQAYTWGGDLPFITDGNATVWTWAASGGFGSQLEAGEDAFGGITGTTAAGPSSANVAALVLDVDNSPTGGDGSLDITILYMVIDL